jgi:hypothetical protein
MLRSRLVLSFVLVLTSAGTASAAINFTRAPSTVVSVRPVHIAVADFNDDGRLDLAVSAPQSREVNVLISNPDGVLAPGTLFRFGARVEGIAAGDLNQDGFPDIAVASERSSGVFTIINNPDNPGSFAPATLRSIGQKPTAVAIADFDGVNGNDLAVIDRTGNRLFIMVNDGRASPSFRASGDYPTGLGPEEIVTVDLNNDNVPDIVTLNLGGRRVKDVSVFLFERVTQGSPVFRKVADFGVGERPQSLVAGDFNGDSFRDVAMINRPTGPFNARVEFLFGTGDGTLLRFDPLELPCPFLTATIACRPWALAAGDFDADGHIDLAVAQDDPRTFAFNDIMAIYIGSGDGFFAPGPVFTTDPVVLAMVAADLAGVSQNRPDGLIDVAVTSSRLSSVQVFQNRTTALGLNDRLPGQRCSNDDQCTTGLCIDGVCCRTECSDIELCNVPGQEGICVPIDDFRPNGFPCDTGDVCQSGFCTDNVCCVVGACPQGARCDIPGSRGVCTPRLPNGEQCNFDEQCRFELCVDGFCCDDACLDGFCDVPGREGTCTPRLPNGQDCSLDAHCVSGICDLVERICCAEVCDFDEACSSDGMSCVPQGMTPGITPRIPGAPCTRKTDCETDLFCTDGVCCFDERCEADHFCQGGTGVCVFGTPSPTPTPTTPGTMTPTATCPAGCTCVGGVVACAGRSGGCSTTDGGGATPSEVFLALLLPIALFLMRRGRVTAAIRRRR